MCVLETSRRRPLPFRPQLLWPHDTKDHHQFKNPHQKTKCRSTVLSKEKKNSHTGRYFPKTSVNLINNEFSFSLKKIVLPFVCFFIVFTNQNIACGELNLKQNGNRPTLHLKSRRLKKENRFSMGVSKHV